MTDTLDLVIITGMSGAGKTVAVQSFEDLGYYCIDNMPPNLLPTFWELMKESGKITKIALVIDLRTREFFHEINRMIQKMANSQFITTKILFLEASDESLVARYKESRRSHPLAVEGRVLEGIQRERELLKELRSRSQYIIDTSHKTPKNLRNEIIKSFSDTDHEPFHVNLVSFGFKYGLPIDADIVMDVRFLPNPYYIESMRHLTGKDQSVYEYVMKQPETQNFYQKFLDLVEFCLPGYKREGKTTVTIAIGCTGGQHRSVALVERIAKRLKNDHYIVNMIHREQ